MMILATVQEFANGYPMGDDMSLTLIQRDADDQPNMLNENGQ